VCPGATMVQSRSILPRNERGAGGGRGPRERERERSLSCPSQPLQPHDIDDTATYLLFAFFYQCAERERQASWSKLFYSSQLACIGPCALISFKFKFSKMRLETRATTENNFAPLLRPPARSLPPSFGTPRGGVDSSRVARFVPPPPCVVGKLNVCSGFPFSSASPYLHKGCFKIIKGPCGTRLPPPIIAG